MQLSSSRTRITVTEDEALQLGGHWVQGLNTNIYWKSKYDGSPTRGALRTKDMKEKEVWRCATHHTSIDNSWEKKTGTCLRGLAQSWDRPSVVTWWQIPLCDWGVLQHPSCQPSNKMWWRHISHNFFSYRCYAVLYGLVQYTIRFRMFLITSP